MPKYTETEKQRLRLALNILGRAEESYVSDDDISALGYDIYKMSYYGRPSMHSLKEKASEIIYDMITKEDEIPTEESDE